MDPFLEGEMWQEFHDTLANEIRRLLLEVLHPRYVALLAKRYIAGQPELAVVGLPAGRVIYPDVHVVESRSVNEMADVKYAPVNFPTVELLTPLPVEIPHLSIEIRDVAERRLVTVIEILSPVNKHGEGFGEYLGKRAAVMRTDTHLLEIDLLRAGERIPLVGGELPPALYYAFLSRADHRPRTEVYPIGLRERLPTLSVPLLPPDPDVPLPLQKCIEACFALVKYERLLDHTQPPLPALSQDDAGWVSERVSLAE